MKAIYIKPLTELVTLNTQTVLNPRDEAQRSNPYKYADAKEAFFDEEEIDDDYDPFFDD